ncbi:MAG: hypothetical protein Q3M24_16100 [Candidatus Electrothrix aestuarii]|uniref:Uncharacterized protein n=1 Tax=Candidatus Electrothrix aestuarii TaxID=3062594 RepID=A0AAU8LRS0_9BACT|nr:hypothetical protein [Candidatus Electrothrix aestuarii]WPD21667.1 MAG: hypothetical protein SD837_15845 [Candidatus Electrothrix sp. GW3-3]
MDDGSGLLVMTAFVVVVLAVAPLLKSKPKRDPFLLDLENWLNGDKKLKDYFEVHIERHFPNFKEWRESNKKK